MPRRSRSRSRSPARRSTDDRRPRDESARSRDVGRVAHGHGDREARNWQRQDGSPKQLKSEVASCQQGRPQSHGDSDGRKHRNDSRDRRHAVDSQETKRSRVEGSREVRKQLSGERDEKRSHSDDKKDRKPRIDDREDRKPRIDDREDRKPRIDDREDRKRRRGDFDRRRNRDDGGKFQWGRADQRHDESQEPQKPKEKANMGLSGKLAEDTNMYKGVLIKYSEPANARLPKKRWRLYPFKGAESLKPLYVHRQSGYLIGRDRKIADIPFDHPSISKQHAVLQYRQVDAELPDGAKVRVIKPYIIDLESANGTFLNGQRIDARRYVELKDKDVLKFGFSTREYVVLSENANQETDGDLVPPSDSESDGGN